jgi:hypothetical protein
MKTTIKQALKNYNGYPRWQLIQIIKELESSNKRVKIENTRLKKLIDFTEEELEDLKAKRLYWETKYKELAEQY